MSVSQQEEACVPLSQKDLVFLGLDFSENLQLNHSGVAKKAFCDLWGVGFDDNFWKALPFSLLQAPVPPSLFEQSLKLALRTPFTSDEERKKFHQALSLFCFKNKEKLDLSWIRKMHESTYGHSLFDFFKHTKTSQDLDFFFTQGIQNDKTLFKLLAIATLNKDHLAPEISDQVQLVFDQKYIVSDLAPKLDNPKTLRLWFEKGLLEEKEATNPQLIGPYVIKGYDHMLNVLYNIAQEEFLPVLLHLHQQKLSFTLPYIHRNFDNFKENNHLWSLREASDIKWLNKMAQKELNMDEFVAWVEKTLIKQEMTKNQTHRIKHPTHNKKM